MANLCLCSMIYQVMVCVCTYQVEAASRMIAALNSGHTQHTVGIIKPLVGTVNFVWWSAKQGVSASALGRLKRTALQLHILRSICVYHKCKVQVDLV